MGRTDPSDDRPSSTAVYVVNQFLHLLSENLVAWFISRFDVVQNLVIESLKHELVEAETPEARNLN